MPYELSLTKAFGELHKTATVARAFTSGLFWFTCVQLAILRPHPPLIPGERSNLFSGLLCLLAVGAAWLFFPKTRPSLKSPAFLISCILAALVMLSCAFSLTPGLSLLRGAVVIAAGFGGFWCARLLLDSRPAQVVFLWLSVFLLATIIGLSLIGYAVSGEITYLIDSNPHPVADRMMLLFFAPLTLILRGRKPEIVVGIALLVLSYVVFYLSSLRSAMLIPLVLGALAVFLGAVRLKYFIALLIPVIVILALFFHHLPVEKLGREYEPAYYRAENYPFSWHIAKKHPWLGIGLRAPREQFLQDYEITYPYVTKETFTQSVRHIVSSENIFLTSMVDLGFPFTLLYVVSVGYLVVRLVRMSQRDDRGAAIPPLLLFISVAAGLVHFQVLDGLIHPQISWFFHILLGMIPTGNGGNPPPSR